MKHLLLMFVSTAAILVPSLQNEAVAGAYLNSAHANSIYGVNRVDPLSTLVYAKGNCKHCHEPHALGGTEQGNETSPLYTPFGNLLFYNNYVKNSQTDGLCFQCHTDTGSVQSGGVVNRSYSYRAGNWTPAIPTPSTSVKQEFSYGPSSSGSSHNLDNILKFITPPSQPAWKYSSAPNPCSACHDPHVVQGDPLHAGNSPKTGTTGWMISRPGQHSDLTGGILWGDNLKGDKNDIPNPTERMSDYTNSYQAPYRYGGTSACSAPALCGYEPDGSMTTDGSNLTDFNTFCLDCHSNANIQSSALGTVKTINWSNGDRHGQLPTSSQAKLILPYDNTKSYVLACTDCHEPHGSPNIFLIRQEVNNGLVNVSGAAQTSESLQWASLCERCHGGPAVIQTSHHAFPGTVCTDCHSNVTPVVGQPYVACTTCHYHGSPDKIYNGTSYPTF